MSSWKVFSDPFGRIKEIQGIVTLGYIYLILMGILNESLYYNQLGVNILNYSDVLDILISPIAKMTSSTAGFAVFLFLIRSGTNRVKYVRQPTPT